MNDALSDFRQKPLSNFWGISLLLLLILVFQIVGNALSTWILSLAYQLPQDQIKVLLLEPDFSALSINLGRWSNLIQFISYMGLPALIFVLANQTKALEYWGKRPSTKPIHYVYSILLGMSALPVIAVLTKMMEGIPLNGQFSLIAKKLMEIRSLLFENMLDMQHPGELIVCLFILAFLPALLEEFLFRGIILKIAVIQYKRVFTAVLFQSVVFAILHLSLYELPGIFLMGLLFGYIAFTQENLYFNALTHFTFNASTIVLHYFLNHSHHSFHTYSVDQFLANATIAIPASMLMGYTIYQLTRKPNKNEIE